MSILQQASRELIRFDFMSNFRSPAREFGPMPFWFLNDDLEEGELLQQIADFDDHGVCGFILHPRVGLPRHLGFMSAPLLDYFRIAIEEARRRGMHVILYDEGSYPSGSASGQVVAADATFNCRGLDHILLKPGDELFLGEDQNLLAIVERSDGSRVAVFDSVIHSHVRGLHYRERDMPHEADATSPASQPTPQEDQPAAADLLNPRAVSKFIEIVYDGYARAFSEYFGNTIIGIFTDEPHALGRNADLSFRPGTTGILDHVNRLLGYDYTTHLPALWYNDEPNAEHYRREYERAINLRLEETYYLPLSQWCEQHGIALTGHPSKPDSIGLERYFHIPGQDIVLRYIEPGAPSALTGPQSTQAKCASSSMIHLNKRRNSNELFGAYGHELTFNEMKWLTDWVLIRGQNLLYPHAFYYSIRGPRFDERPPDVGPNSPWWGQYKQYADYVRRMCWLNTDSQHVCKVAILGNSDYLPDLSAKVCFQNQIDFNYLEDRHLWEDVMVDRDGLHLAEMCYKVLIVDSNVVLDQRAIPLINQMSQSNRVLAWESSDHPALGPDVIICSNERELLTALDQSISRDCRLIPARPDIRVRHVVKDNTHCYAFVNEGLQPVTFTPQIAVAGDMYLIDPYAWTHHRYRKGEPIALGPYETRVIRIV